MTPNVKTNLYQLIEGFQTFATDHKQINHFGVGPVDDADVAKLSADDHPIMYITPGGVTLDEGTILMDIDIIVGTMQPPSNEERMQVLSNMLYIMKDTIAWLKHHLSENEFRGRITLELPVACEPFTTKLDNLLVGYTSVVSLEWNNENDLCLVPGV